VVPGRSPTLTSVVAGRPVAVSSIDGAGFGFAPIRRTRLPPLCLQPEHTSCRFPLLRRTRCFRVLARSSISFRQTLAARPALASGGCRPRFSQGSGPTGPTSPFDQPLRGRFQVPVRSMQRVC
jgi:hypothetical protein